MARKSLLPDDFGARVRAARGYAAMSRLEFAKKLDTEDAGEGTIKSWENDPSKRPRPLAEAELVHRLAEVSGLPEAFFTADLAGLFENVPASLDARLSAIQEKLESLVGSGAPAPDAQPKTLEQLLDVSRALYRQQEELAGRLGRDRARRGLESKRAMTDPPREAPPAAA